jgi:hypothetical protein
MTKVQDVTAGTIVDDEAGGTLSVRKTYDYVEPREGRRIAFTDLNGRFLDREYDTDIEVVGYFDM